MTITTTATATTTVVFYFMTRESASSSPQSVWFYFGRHSQILDLDRTYWALTFVCCSHPGILTKAHPITSSFHKLAVFCHLSSISTEEL